MLKALKNEDILFFNNDDEFYKFCVFPETIITKEILPDGSECYCADFDFSDQYKNALAQGKKFMILDENSQIFKHGEITYRVNTKPVEGLLEYYDFPVCKECKEEN